MNKKEMEEIFFEASVPPIVFLNMKTNTHYFRRGGGPYLIPWKESKKLIKSLIKYYDIYSEEDIEDFNNETDEEMKRSMNRKIPKQEPIPIEGYIYLLRADNGMIKIGKTIKVENRIKQTSPKLPYDLEIVRVFKVKDYVKAEREFHKYYDCRRMNPKSEWIRLTDENWKEYWDNSFPKQIKDLIIGE